MASVRCIVVWKCDTFRFPFMCRNTASSSLTTVLHPRQGIWGLVLPCISRNPLYAYHPQRDHHISKASRPCATARDLALTSHPSLLQRTRVLSCLFIFCLLLHHSVTFWKVTYSASSSFVPEEQSLCFQLLKNLL